MNASAERTNLVVRQGIDRAEVLIPYQWKGLSLVTSQACLYVRDDETDDKLEVRRASHHCVLRLSGLVLGLPGI